ncbi:DUF6752 domain-containing protein [Nocardioides gilvus]|uniref:DUF6752 domain-containing protein n=1 Tax=Nocardioides gilvus TaxID=1735589 RepID=UPI000D74A807|nr:DUF6752 domain-containing protein [Nocardioides gilvus]
MSANKSIKGRARTGSVWFKERVRRVQDNRGNVQARLAALEAEVQENRHLNRRITEIADVVAELLVPLHLQDEEKVNEVLERYRNSI